LQDRSPAALCRGDAEVKLVRGNFLRMTDLRLRPAYISVAVSRSTEPRRVVETLEPARHRVEVRVTISPARPATALFTKPWRTSSPIVLATDDRAVKAAPSGGLRPALTALDLLPRDRSNPRAPENPREEPCDDRLDTPFHISAATANLSRVHGVSRSMAHTPCRHVVRQGGCDARGGSERSPMTRATACCASCGARRGRW
jgi:hypothetical protein